MLTIFEGTLIARRWAVGLGALLLGVALLGSLMQQSRLPGETWSAVTFCAGLSPMLFALVRPSGELRSLGRPSGLANGFRRALALGVAHGLVVLSMLAPVLLVQLAGVLFASRMFHVEHAELLIEAVLVAAPWSGLLVRSGVAPSMPICVLIFVFVPYGEHSIAPLLLWAVGGIGLSTVLLSTTRSSSQI